MDEIKVLLALQDGVIARRQALTAGVTPTYVARQVRRGTWVPVHPGVFVTHNGPMTWHQRAWAAVLATSPSALHGWSALRAHEGPGRRRRDDGPIEIVVPHGAQRRPLAGVRVQSSRRFDESVALHLSPPRERYDDAIIGLADTVPGELEAIGILADACGGRRTTADRLLAALERMSRLRRRSWLRAILTDIAEGTCSVLEHAYLTRVERPHGLPRGLRQLPAVDDRGRNMFRDVLYGGSRPRWRQIVELDGRLWHDSTKARDNDMERDFDAALELQHTVRLGYGQVFDRACGTAAKMGRLLQLRGWRGTPIACPECPEASGRTTARF